MAERQVSWAAAEPVPPGYLPTRELPHSAPVFSALPPRPFYREPHPITAGAVISGLAATTLWFVLFGSLGDDLGSYAWWTLGAAVAAWIVALLLAVLGDRGVAVGVAVASGIGLSIALFLVNLQWYQTLDWPLW